MASSSKIRSRHDGGIVWGCFIFSLLAHLVVLILLVVRWTVVPLPEPKPAQPVDMVFDAAPSSTAAARALQKAKKPVPPAPQEMKAPSVPEPPKPTPPEPTPPVAPPPPKVHTAPEPTLHQVKAPVQQKAPVSKTGEVSEKLTPHKKTAAAPSQVKAAEQKADKKVMKPKLSRTHQLHETPKPQADSRSLLSTLDSYRIEQKQEHAPRAHANPQQGGSPHGGGRPDGDTRALSSGEQRAIGAAVQRCYQEDTAARNYTQFEAHLVVTVDGTGEAHLVTFAAETAARMASDPAYRVQAERARSAVLSPVCARLPIPSRMLGQRRQLRFVFKP